MHELLRKEDVPIRIAVGRHALSEGRDLVLDGRRLDDDGQSRSRMVEPARRHRRDGGREDGTLGFRWRPADPLGEEPARLLRPLGCRERRERDLFDLLLRALRVRIEEAERLHAVAVELHAHREIPVRREDIEEAPAHGEISGLDDEVSTPVAEPCQPLGQPREGDFVSPADPDEELREARGFGKPGEQRARRKDRGHRTARVPVRAREGGQERELVAPGLQRGRDPLVRRQRRGRSVEDARDSGPLEVADPPLGVLLARDDDRERTRKLAGESGEEQGRQRADAPGNDNTAPAAWGGDAVLSLTDPLEEVRVRREPENQIREQQLEKPEWGKPESTLGAHQRRFLPQARDGRNCGLGGEVDFLLGGPPAHAEADRRVGEIRRDADRRQHVRGLQRGRCTGRAGGDRDILHADEEGLPLDARKGEIEVAGQAASPRSPAGVPRPHRSPEAARR